MPQESSVEDQVVLLYLKTVSLCSVVSWVEAAATCITAEALKCKPRASRVSLPAAEQGGEEQSIKLSQNSPRSSNLPRHKAELS